jgi:hypothetical protein
VTEISSGAMPDLQPAAAPAQACVNDMVLDAILTYDDKNMTSPPPVPPGQPFIKGWRVRNTGTCTWDANYQLVYDIGSPQGAQMNGQPLTLAGQTPPGSTLDLQLSLSAPVQGGIYHGMWSLREPSGHLFGQRLIVGVNVSMQPTNTPFPTATASPTILFTANPGHIRAGDPVTLQWAVSGPGQVYVYAVGEPWQNYPVPPTGSRLAYPAVTTIYELRYIHPDNQVETRQVTVLVDPTPNAPQIFLFSITPPYQIYQGQSLEIDWDVRGQVTSVRILRNNGVLYDRAPFRGSINDTPQAAGVYTYVLEATGPGGVNRQSRTVYVYPPVVFTPTPTSPAPITPTPIIDPVFIRSFSVMPSQVQIGACVQISWDIVGALANLRLERAGKVIVDGNSAVNTATDCPDTIGTVVYTLTATNPVGQSDARQDSVQVDPVMPTVGPVGPVIQSFTGSADTVDVGQCVVLSWSVTGDAITNIALTVNGAPLTNTMDKNGSYNSCPTAAGRFTYQLDVTASGGSASDTFVVDVQEPLPTFAPPPTDEPPVPATDEPPLPPTIEPPLQPTDLPAPDIQDTPTPESSSSVAAWLGWAVDQVYSMGSQVVSSWH